jgi:hypothetical protein
MTDDETENNQVNRKGDALEQLMSVAVSGSSVQTEPGTDPNDISDDS